MSVAYSPGRRAGHRRTAAARPVRRSQHSSPDLPSSTTTNVTPTTPDVSGARPRTSRPRTTTLAVVTVLGPVAAVAAILLSIVTGTTALSSSAPPWAVWVGLAALALGVPHGAVDHLVILRAEYRRTQLLLGSAYLLLALLALAVILLAPAASFVGVLAMSVWHFGSGDVEASRDLRSDASPVRRQLVLTFALGAAPVLLPLTSAASVATLSLVDADLVGVLTPTVATVVRAVVLLAVAWAIVDLMRSGNRRGALELALLAVLGMVATPLLAFGVYFSFWHAARHTARLAQDRPGDPVTPRQLWHLVRAGLPALVVAAVAVVGAAATTDGSVTVLWLGLALVWALTVPHMTAVGVLDRRRRAARAAAA